MALIFPQLQRIGTGSWDYCLQKLGGNKSLALATARQIMQDRISRYTNNREDREHFSSGAWPAENFNVINGRIFGAREEFNPLIRYAKQATETHRANKEFYLTSEIVDASEKPYSQLLAEIAVIDSKEFPNYKRVIDLGHEGTHKVPTDCFGDDKTIVWLAQDAKFAHKYGKEFLKDKLGFDYVEVYLPEISKADFARGFWFYALSGGSAFSCGNKDLGSRNGSVFVS